MDTLLCILKSNEIRLCDIEKSNDYAEKKWMMNLINSKFQNIITKLNPMNISIKDLSWIFIMNWSVHFLFVCSVLFINIRFNGVVIISIQTYNIVEYIHDFHLISFQHNNNNQPRFLPLRH